MTRYRNKNKPDLQPSMDMNDHRSKGKHLSDGIQIGEGYQATIPNLMSKLERNSEDYFERGSCCWHPPTEVQLSDQQLDDYIHNARSAHGYSVEQALGLLYYRKYNLMQVNEDIKAFAPFVSDDSITSDEDKALFEKALASRGKDFFRIRSELLPQKSLKYLVEYYYMSKHKVARKSNKRKKNKRHLVEEKSSELAENRNISSPNDVIPTTNHVFKMNGVEEHKLNKKICITSAQNIETIKLNVLGPDNLIVPFRINKLDPLRNLMMKYCNKVDLPMANAHFRFDGVTIYERDTPSLLKMIEGDTISVFKDKQEWISVRSPKFWSK